MTSLTVFPGTVILDVFDVNFLSGVGIIIVAISMFVMIQVGSL